MHNALQPQTGSYAVSQWKGLLALLRGTVAAPTLLCTCAMPWATSLAMRRMVRSCRLSSRRSACASASAWLEKSSCGMPCRTRACCTLVRYCKGWEPAAQVKRGPAGRLPSSSLQAPDCPHLGHSPVHGRQCQAHDHVAGGALEGASHQAPQWQHMGMVPQHHHHNCTARYSMGCSQQPARQESRLQPKEPPIHSLASWQNRAQWAGK